MKYPFYLLGALLLVGTFCQGQDLDECSLPTIKQVEEESGLRELQFLAPVTNGHRVSRCYGKGPPLCDADETQSVADDYCVGVGFQFAYFWRATTLNNTDCYPKVMSVDRKVCNNEKIGGFCQGFETITCAGPKVMTGFLESGVGFGSFIFAQDGHTAPVQMNITLEDLPDSEMDFAIHEHSSLGGCENTGREMRCDGERGCGDLSGRLGELKGPDVDLTMEDSNITLFGKDSLEGKSVVLFDTRGRRIACGTIGTGVNITIPAKLVSDIAENDLQRASGKSSPKDHQTNVFGKDDEYGSEEEEKTSETPFLDSTDAYVDDSSGVDAVDLPNDIIADAPGSSSSDSGLELPSPLVPETRFGSPEVSSRCPIGKTCQIRKCRTGCDGLQTCCRCQKWYINDGMCPPDGWIKVGGPGDCNFNSDCPPGVVCIGVKRLKSFNGADFDETCCECLRHKPDGTCQAGAFQLVSGSGDCNFDVEDDASDSLNTSGATAQGE